MTKLKAKVDATKLMDETMDRIRALSDELLECTELVVAMERELAEANMSAPAKGRLLAMVRP